LQTTHNGQGGGKPTIIGQRGLKIKMRLLLLSGHTTLSCRKEGPNKIKKSNLKAKTNLAQ